MFGAISGVRLEKREERGLVRTRTLRRWGTPLNAPELPGERPKPRSRRRSRAPAGGAFHPPALEPTTGPCSAVGRSLTSPEAERPSGASVCLCAPSAGFAGPPPPRAGEDHGEIVPQRILTRLRGTSSRPKAKSLQWSDFRGEGHEGYARMARTTRRVVEGAPREIIQ